MNDRIDPAHDSDDRPDDELDQRLRDALGEEAAHAAPTSDLDDVHHRVDRATRPRWVPGAVAAAVVLFATVVGFLVLDPDDEGADVVTDPDPTPTSEPGERPTTSTTSTTLPSDPDIIAVEGTAFAGFEAPVGEPLPRGQFVAAIMRPNAAIMRPNAADPPTIDIVRLGDGGREIEILLEDFGSAAEGGIYGLTLSPDRRTLYFVTATSACGSEVWAMPADGSAEPTSITDRAHGVAVSPDGSALALVTGSVCERPAGDGPAVEIAPVDGGTTQRFELPSMAGSMVWRDPRTLVAATGGEPTALYDLDPTAGAGREILPDSGADVGPLATGSDGAVVGLLTPPGSEQRQVVRYEDGELSPIEGVAAITAEFIYDFDVLADGRLSTVVTSAEADDAYRTTWWLDGESLRDDVGSITE